MSERLSDEALARLSTPGPITKIEYPDGKDAVLHIVTVRHGDLTALLAELRDRRAADLTDEDMEALLDARQCILHHCKRVSTNGDKWHRAAIAALSKILGGVR